ncbi:MAG TPA: hypothetical protein VGO62_06720 [Myxococcota bacterium]
MIARRALVLVASCAALAVPACNCATPLSSADAGDGVFDAGAVVDAGAVHDAGTVVVDAGFADAGFVDAGSAVVDAGPSDSGVDDRDAGNGFDLGGFLDGGAGACLPDSLPQLSITGALDALGLSPLYFGGPEHGVRCGIDPQVTCGADTPCCVLCGLAGCGVDTTDAGAPTTCPFFATAYNCDGDEDCAGNDVCCFTLGGTECRAQSDCDFNVAATLGQFLQDGGISLNLPDAGVVDGGFFDGGFSDAFIDGGSLPDGGGVDGGDVQTPVQGPAGPVPDAGSFLDGLQSTLDQGVPVCHTFFDCSFGDACCSSDRLPALDIGMCLPALLCAGSLIP